MHKEEVIRYFDALAPHYDRWISRNSFYHRCIASLYSLIIPPSQRVLQVGCATADLLAHVKPSAGVGIDTSAKMVEIAKRKYPGLQFLAADIATFSQSSLAGKFDYIIMSNLIDYLPDVLGELSGAAAFLDENGLMILTSENPLWRPLMRLGSILRLRMPDGPRNFVTNADVANLVQLAGLEVVKRGRKFFVPVYIPLISTLINFLISELPLARNLCLLQYIVVRLPAKRKPLACSVVIPCYNEEGNIEECIRRIPRMGQSTEVIVVDDGSTDGTAERVRKMAGPAPSPRLITQPSNMGKGRAVKAGCDSAGGDVIMILDADMSVAPEELPAFFDPLQKGLADFVNGTRMVYPMEGQAMRHLNYIGNKFFNTVLSWLMEQRISDTLCGTKAFLREDYRKIAMGRCRWGDFDLLIGIARLKKKILELPVHYQARVAGQSKMRVIRHGLLLARMCWIGFCELKLFKKQPLIRD
jgi:SAM-dependent methyltransferase